MLSVGSGLGELAPKDGAARRLDPEVARDSIPIRRR